MITSSASSSTLILTRKNCGRGSRFGNIGKHLGTKQPKPESTTFENLFQYNLAKWPVTVENLFRNPRNLYLHPVPHPPGRPPKCFLLLFF